jgi:AAA15 family ATPase/GTPase
MLIQFSIKNYKIFKEKTVFSLVASNYDKTTREKENVSLVQEQNLRILKSAVIYGANASGKSKFIEALNFVRTFTIKSSGDSQKDDPIGVEPFRLNTDSENDSSEFELVFIMNKELFRFGFEVNSSRIETEWLYHKPKTKEIEVFYREGQQFKLHRSFTKGHTVVKEGLVRDNALLLSVAAQFNDQMSGQILNWFKGLKSISGLHEEGYRGFTMSRAEDSSYKSKILNLLKAADLGIQDISIETKDLSNLPKEMPRKVKDLLIKRLSEENASIVDIITSHRKYNSNKIHSGDVNFSLDIEESSGTQKFFSLTGPILDVLENGFTLFIDELDSKLHPNLVCKLVSLFNSKESNPKNAQLIFNTHDTNLLNSGLFRRDQIWFAEKDRYGEAKLYSLTDFKSEVRKGENFEDNYIRGKYGAIPFLGDFEDLISNNSLQVDEK